MHQIIAVFNDAGHGPNPMTSDLMTELAKRGPSAMQNVNGPFPVADSMGGDLAPNLGGTQKNFRDPISGKISIFRVKISDDLFFSHRPGSSDFSFLFPHFPYVYYVKCRI